MPEWKVLPLGIDLGSTRARVALAEAHRNGSTRIRAVVARDLPDGVAAPTQITEPELVAAVLEEMMAELGARERRCVLALSASASALRFVTFPMMSWAERVRAARYEAQRFSGWDLEAERAVVRVHAVDRANGIFAIGVARPDAIETRVAAVRKAGLRAVALDHDALALRRLFPEYDAIVDVGAEQSNVHLFGERGPSTVVVDSGGASVTKGIAAELALDLDTAERRKRILGCAGAGVAARVEVIGAIAGVLERARARTRLGRIALTGNGARIPNFARELEEATDAITDMVVPDLLRSDVYPDDVVRAASPDWALAASLATWKIAA